MEITYYGAVASNNNDTPSQVHTLDISHFDRANQAIMN